MVYSGGLTGREAEAGWYIDVERMEEGDASSSAAAVRLGASAREPSQFSRRQQQVHVCTVQK